MESFKTHIKNTISLAIPISIGQLGHIMMGVIDSIMVGQIGSVPLAAASLVNGLFFLILVLGIGMSYAVTPLVAISRGAQKSKECGLVLNQALIVNIIFSILLSAIIIFGSGLIKFLNQPEEVAILAVSYLQILGLSVLPFMLFQTIRQFLEGISLPRPPMIIAIAANFVNAFFNWILIYGNLGFPAMGLDGAGWATFTTRILLGMSLIFFVLKSTSLKEYNPHFKISEIDLSLIKKIVRIGLPSGLTYFFEVGAFAFAAIMIGWLGSVPLAAHQIGINLASVTYMVILGISAAGTVRVGNAVGRADIVETRRAGFSALALSTTFMFIAGLTFILLRRVLPTIYINEIEVIELASDLLIVAALFQMSDGIQATGAGILRGLTDVKIPMIIIFISYWLLGIPIAYLLGFYFNYGTIGIWVGLLIGLTAVAILLLVRFNIKSKHSNLHLH
ncbi:MATE family efflux transporter [Bacteroidota bacterium]